MVWIAVAFFRQIDDTFCNILFDDSWVIGVAQGAASLVEGKPHGAGGVGLEIQILTEGNTGRHWECPSRAGARGSLARPLTLHTTVHELNSEPHYLQLAIT
jgi:hypothetical protein